jgi:hypothetical protein
MKAFIVSYPAHTKLAKVCEHYLKSNVVGVTEVVHLWDDFHGMSCPYEGATVVNFSEFKFTDRVRDNGWLRQQFVKLQLYQVTDDEGYYVIDGDTWIRNKIDLQNNRMIVSPEYYPPYFEFINHALGLKKQVEYSFISPLLFFEREVLVELEKFSLTRNGLGVMQTYINYLNETKDSTTFSEGEIYGTFATQVLKREYDQIHHAFMECTKEHTNGKVFEDLFYNTNHDLVWSGDQAWLSEDFWNSINHLMAQ